MEGKEIFDQLTVEFTQTYPEVQPGKMMSSPAILVGQKVFAFFSKDGNMVFRLGKGFDPGTAEARGIFEFNPFKNKGPLKGWFVVPVEENHLWKKYADHAFEITKKLKK